MNTRPAEERDYEVLKSIHERAKLRFPLPDFSSPMIEANEVVVDDRGEIIMAGIAHRTAEIYLLAPPGFHPMVKMEAIRLLHQSIRDNIAPKGYSEAFSFVQPEFARFGRHLHKWFGWEKTWQAYRVLDWKGEPCQKA